MLDWCARGLRSSHTVVAARWLAVSRRFDEPVVTVDVTAMSAVLEIDRVSQRSRAHPGGAFGPIEHQLRPQ